MDQQTRPTFPGLDILTPEYATNRDFYIAKAHQDYPVHYYEPLDIWILSKHADVRAVYHDSETYSSAAWGLVPPPADLAPRVMDMNDDARINALDPPEHAKLRVPVQQAFLPAKLVGVDDLCRKIANDIVDEFVDDGECDLLHAFSTRFALTLIVRLLGLPPERSHDYHRWAMSFFSLFTPKPPEGVNPDSLRKMPDEVLRARWTDIAEANEFLRGVVEGMDANPGENLLSHLLQLREPDGERTLSFASNVRNALDFVAAGHDTTANLITHLTYFSLTVPGLRDKLLADPSLIPSAVVETVRRRGSADGSFRRAMRDVEIRGVKIPKEAILYLHINAANLDPEVFEDPEEFILDRPNIKQMMAFGFGRHVCLGQHLARVEAKIAYEVLTERLPNLRLKEGFKITYTPAVMNMVINELPVVWNRL